MKTPNYSPDEFITAAIFNSGFGLVSGDFAQGVAGTTIPGLVNPEDATFIGAGLTINSTLPAPVGIIFANGVLAQAHGTLTNADTQSYATAFGGLVPGSGSVTAYLLASLTSIQQGAYSVVGPPPGHPDYNPSFVPYTAYSQNVDSLALSASLAPADNATTFELARITLAAGASGVGTINTAFQVRASGRNCYGINTVSGNTALQFSDAGKLFTATAAADLTLPLASGCNGLVYGLNSITSGAVNFASTAPDFIYGYGGVPTSGRTSIGISQNSTAFVGCVDGIWQVIGGTLVGVGGGVGITDIVADSPLTGGGSSGVVHVGVSGIASGYVFVNATSGVAPPIGTAPTTWLDFLFGNTPGTIVQRGNAIWQALAAGASGFVITSAGPGAPVIFAPTQVSQPGLVVKNNTSYTAVSGVGGDLGKTLYFTNTGFGLYTLTLPSAVNAGNDWYIDLVVDSNDGDAIQIATGGGTIDGKATRGAGTGTRVRIMSDGTNWKSVQGSYRWKSAVRVGATAGWADSTRNAFTHNLNFIPTKASVRFINASTEFNYSVGDVVEALTTNADNFQGIITTNHDASGNGSSVSIGTGFAVANKTTGANSGFITVAKWNMQLVVEVSPP